MLSSSSSLSSGSGCFTHHSTPLSARVFSNVAISCVILSWLYVCMFLRFTKSMMQCHQTRKVIVTLMKSWMNNDHVPWSRDLCQNDWSGPEMKECWCAGLPLHVSMLYPRQLHHWLYTNSRMCIDCLTLFTITHAWY